MSHDRPEPARRADDLLAKPAVAVPSVFARRAAAPSAAQLRRRWIADYGWATLLALATAGALVWAKVGGDSIRSDHALSPEVTEEAVLIAKVAGGHDGAADWAVTLQMKAERISDDFRSYPGIENLRPGDRLSVTYRRGRSGTIYPLRVGPVDRPRRHEAP